MDKPYTVTIAQANPPYAPEAVLRLRAESPEAARAKASAWIASLYSLFVEEGHAREDQLEEDVRIVDVPDFAITVEEANVLDKIASSTKMDGWFLIDGDLHVRDLENGEALMGDAEGVLMLDDGLAYPLVEHEGLTPQEKETYVSCLNRARASKGLPPVSTEDR